MAFDFENLSAPELTAKQFCYVQDELLGWDNYALARAVGIGGRKNNAIKNVERFRLGEKARDHKKVPGTVVTAMWLYLYEGFPEWMPEEPARTEAG